MKTLIGYIPWLIVTMPATLILTEALNVALLPALGIVFLVSTTTSFASAFSRAIDKD